MTNHPSSVTATVRLTIEIQQTWMIDESPKRKSSHQCTVKVLSMSQPVGGIHLKKTIVRLRARTEDFSSGLPELTVGQVVTIEVKNTPAAKAKGKKNSAYYCLVPRFGACARPQPAMLVTGGSKSTGEENLSSASVKVTLVGKFTGSVTSINGSIKRRFLVDTSCVAGGCAGTEISLFGKGGNVTSLITAIPEGVDIELSGVRVVNKGTHFYASACSDFATDHQPVRAKL